MNASESANHDESPAHNAADGNTGPIPAASTSSEKPVRFVGRRRADAAKVGTALENGMSSCDLVGQDPPFKSKNKVFQAIPTEILENEELNKDLKALPAHYNFEIHKTIWRLKQAKVKTVALQLPEGLQLFACTLSDIIGAYADVEVVILGDVTYGACCVDDLNARALGAEFLVHYGHSCLVPIDSCTLPVLYIFVDIAIDTRHLVASLAHAFPTTSRLLLVSTVQFVASLHTARPALEAHFAQVTLPQARPLSKGEVLGCTAPTIDAATADAVVYVGDGRFHLEAIMIANPALAAYRYDPYSKVLSSEGYAHDQLHHNRKAAIETARSAGTFGVILGTLGRQGSVGILDRLLALLRSAGRPAVVVLLSEISPAKLSLFRDVDAWVQVACPRLSIDWGHQFERPLLTPYELEVALETAVWQPVYPMDYYAQAAGPWANIPNRPSPAPRPAAAAATATATAAVATAAAAAAPAATAAGPGNPG